MLANPQGSVAQAVQGGLGKVGSPVPEQQGYAKNSSLALFEIANAEKQRAKEMQFENEALRARGEQMRLGAENQAMQMSQIDAQVNSALKNGQLDEATALQLLQDRNVSDATKQNIANVFYPVQAGEKREVRSPDSIFHDPNEYDVESDYQRQAQIDAQSRAAGKPGIRNVNWDNGRNIDDYITTDQSRASDGMNIDERQRYRYQ
jgi:hypothetical protein